MRINDRVNLSGLKSKSTFYLIVIIVVLFEFILFAYMTHEGNSRAEPMHQCKLADRLPDSKPQVSSIPITYKKLNWDEFVQKNWDLMPTKSWLLNIYSLLLQG